MSFPHEQVVGSFRTTLLQFPSQTSNFHTFKASVPIATGPEPRCIIFYGGAGGTRTHVRRELPRWPAVLRPVAHDLPFLVCGKDVHIPALKSPAQSQDILWWSAGTTGPTSVLRLDFPAS